MDNFVCFLKATAIASSIFVRLFDTDGAPHFLSCTLVLPLHLITVFELTLYFFANFAILSLLSYISFLTAGVVVALP